MKLTTTATVIAAALAIFTDPTQARIGGWNGAAAQAAAIAISGFSGGQLNGPSSGPARVNIRNGPAPIVRVIRDEDDGLGNKWMKMLNERARDEDSILGDRGHNDRKHGRAFEDEDNLLGGFRNPVYANNREHNAREGYASVPAGGRYDSAFYKRHHDPNYYADTDDDDLLGNCNDSDWWRHSYCHTRFQGGRRDEDTDDELGGIAGALMSPAAFKIAQWGQRVGPYVGPMVNAVRGRL